MAPGSMARCSAPMAGSSDRSTNTRIHRRLCMITARQAHRMLAAGEDKAAALGVPVNIALLDAGGHLKAFVRMDGAVLGSIDVAIRKARTAVLFESASEAVWDYCKPGAPAPGLELSNGGLAPFAG